MDYFNDYGRDYGGFDFLDDPEFLSVFGAIMVFFAIIAFIAVAFNVVLYIFRSIGLYKLSSNRGMSGAGLAWIPIVGSFRIGSIADDIAARNGSSSYYRYILLVGSIVNLIFPIISAGSFFEFLKYAIYDYGYGYGYESTPYPGFMLLNSGISSISSLVSLGLYIVKVIALHYVYKSYRPQSATTWTVLSAIPFTNFLHSIFLFIIRDAVPVEAGNTTPGYYHPQQNLPPNINWQPPQYPPYGQPPQNDGYNQQPPTQYGYQPPTEAGYQPPSAPNPPESWEIHDNAPPPRAPWEKDGD